MFFESFGAKSCAIDFQTEITEWELELELDIWLIFISNERR